jgi:hypothetical protein
MKPPYVDMKIRVFRDISQITDILGIDLEEVDLNTN